MKKKHKLSKEVKDQILGRIKNEGVPVSQAAEDHGVSTQSIYSWLTKGVKEQPSMLEYAKLKRENQTLKEMIGELTVDLRRTQKNN